MSCFSINRVGDRLLRGLLLCALLYVLSSGPASRWVVSGVSGTHASDVDISTYDRRLRTYYRVYGPLLRLRLRLRSQSTAILSRLFWSYDELFSRPRELADGREVTTILSPPPRPGESTSQYIERILGEGFPTPRPGTKVWDLPLSRMTLLVLDRAEDDLIVAVLNSGSRHSVASYAELEIP